MFLSPVFGGESRGQRPDVGNGITSSLIASHVDGWNVVMPGDDEAYRAWPLLRPLSEGYGHGRN